MFFYYANYSNHFNIYFRTGGDLCYSPQKACRLITATMVLHNFCIQRGIELLEEDDDNVALVIHEEREMEMD